MGDFHTIVVYGILFVSLYFEILLLITYLSGRKSIQDNATMPSPTLWPSVTIVVPCFNEEKTVAKTIDSLLALDYPREKLSIVAVDDGSKDSTKLILSAYEQKGVIRSLSKENGGKHTALNLAISQAKTDLVGCLDADSYVETGTLKKLVKHFANEKVMAVIPSLKIHEPKTIIQMIQAVEYRFGVFLRKIFAELDALYVTPGPFSIFRRSVFTLIGPYRKAHNTEDLEIAMRMQSKHLKIVNAHDAYVHTSSPRTLKKLYTQRVRWTSGFLKNVLDYRFMFLRPTYGNLGLIVLPLACFSILSVAYITGSVIIDGAAQIIEHVTRWSIVGINFEWPTFNWFFFNTNVLVTSGAVAFLLGFLFLLIGYKLSNEKRFFHKELVWYMMLYHLIVPLWVIRSLWNVALSRETTWR